LSILALYFFELLLGQSFKKGIHTHLIQLRDFVLHLILAYWVLIYEHIDVVRASLVGLLELVVQDLRVINAIATLEATESHSFVNHVHPIVGDGWFLVLFNQEVRPRLEFQDGNRRLVGAALLSYAVFDLPLGFHHPKVVLIYDVMLAAQTVRGSRKI
jgi:hypothetical protein